MAQDQYEYSREMIDDAYWNINNPYDVNDQGIAVPLLQRIIDALPESNATDVLLQNSVAVVLIDTLDDQQKLLLDETVAAHKNAQGTLNQTTYINLLSSNGTGYMVFVDDDGILQTQLQ